MRNAIFAPHAACLNRPAPSMPVAEPPARDDLTEMKEALVETRAAVGLLIEAAARLDSAIGILDRKLESGK